MLALLITVIMYAVVMNVLFSNKALDYMIKKELEEREKDDN